MSKPISIEVRQAQVLFLIEALDDLIKVLELDPSCHWVKHFRTARTRARSISTATTQDAFNAFATTVTSVYGGMGSFNDYHPCPQDKRKKASSKLHSMENLTTFSTAVYDRAINLKVVGSR